MYATLKENCESKSEFYIYSGPKSNCNYVVGVHVFCILYGCVSAALNVYALIKQSRQKFEEVQFGILLEWKLVICHA